MNAKSTIPAIECCPEAETAGLTDVICVGDEARVVRLPVTAAGIATAAAQLGNRKFRRTDDRVQEWNEPLQSWIPVSSAPVQYEFCFVGSGIGEWKVQRT